MINTYFSPKGTLHPSGFLTAGLVLIALGTVLVFAGQFAPSMGRLGLVLSLALAYPWICIWIKRLRYGGVSPALVLAYLTLYAALYFVFFLISIFFFSGGDIMTLVGEYSRQEITMEEYQAGIQENIDPAAALRNMVVSGILASLLTLFIGNMATPKTAETP